MMHLRIISAARPIVIGALVLLSLALALVLGRWLAVVQAPLSRQAVGHSLLENGAADQAAYLFETPIWQGVALYRAERYHRSVGAFVTDGSVTGLYNMGNAYARLGLYQGAATAYETVLSRQPTHEDARFNLELVRAAEKRKRELEDESRNTENAGNWEDGLLENEQEEPPNTEIGEQTSAGEEDDGLQEETPPSEQENQEGAMQPAMSEAETTGQGVGGSEQENDLANEPTFSLSGSDQDEADNLAPNNGDLDNAEVLGGAMERQREEAMADQILLRRIEDDPAIVLRARLNMALRKQQATR
jgi:Ca-activated chloride channel family protein